MEASRYPKVVNGAGYAIGDLAHSARGPAFARCAGAWG